MPWLCPSLERCDTEQVSYLSFIISIGHCKDRSENTFKMLTTLPSTQEMVINIIISGVFNTFIKVIDLEPHKDRCGVSCSSLLPSTKSITY